MPEYHGDIMYKVGNVYSRQDDRNYPVAIILALLLGPIGAHRFFLNDLTIGFFYFWPFCILALIGAVTLNFTLLVWFLALAWLAVLVEIVYFIVCWARR